jgi:hypothetical protein
MTITLTPEIEQALAAQARQRGLTPDQLAQELLADRLRELSNEQTATEPSQAEEGTLADLLAGQIGIISGSSEPLSHDTGQRFSDYVTRKRQEGRL